MMSESNVKKKKIFWMHFTSQFVTKANKKYVKKAAFTIPLPGTMMKSIIALLFLLVSSSTQAFIPSSVSLSSLSSTTKKSSSTEQYALADRIFNLDLFSPNKDQNNYGARKQKNIKLGKITEKSYVPSGMTLQQYEKIRMGQQKKKDENYQRNVKKAGVFTDYTEWYTKRGTELTGAWKKSVTLGHNMAKTKYDWSGTSEAKQYDGTTNEKFVQDIFGNKKKVMTKKPIAVTTKKPTTTTTKKMSFY
jgi:hypothetical protein